MTRNILESLLLLEGLRSSVDQITALTLTGFLITLAIPAVACILLSTNNLLLLKTLTFYMECQKNHLMV